MKQNIAVITVGRSDLSCYRPVLERLLQEKAKFQTTLFVSGSHLQSDSLREVEQIAQGEPICSVATEKSPNASLAAQIGTLIKNFDEQLNSGSFDQVIVLGDRFEMYAAALAAYAQRIPIVHLHGGEITDGALDDGFRHSITKLANVHCVATAEARKVVLQLGEEESRVFVTGAPALDNLKSVQFLSKEQLKEVLKLSSDEPPIVVTYHPVTARPESQEQELEALCQALDQVTLPLVITGVNADPGSTQIANRLQSFVAENPSQRVYVENLGTERYFSLLRMAALMVGNSSSGIIEAASFALPVVNLGDRQAGRYRPQNVIDVVGQPQEIVSAIERALSPHFQRSFAAQVNPYGDGNAAAKIVEVLKRFNSREQLLKKSFVVR